MSYTLSQLFGEDLTIVIPAIQRDYCWGADTDKVTPFIRGILQLYITDRDAPLGLLYGYESPEGSRRIHIIDGQQRLTTLYLLIGMLYRRTPTPELRRMLISDYQLIDEREPRLLYQVRSEAMYFMSDLVMNFFLNRDGRLSQLERSSWYYRSYDADPTVQNFIGAIRRIDSALEDADLDPEWDFGAFAWFVTQRLAFRYYDLGNRSTAEQQFVTINTTGEPLTRAQAMRAVLYNASPSMLEAWDSIDDWCWRLRPQGASTSDPALDTFLSLYTVMRGHAPDVSAAHDLVETFATYRRVVQACGYPTVYDPEAPAVQYTLLPMLAYADRFPDVSDRAIERLHTFLSRQLLYRRPAANGADTLALLNLIESMPEAALESLASLPASQDYLRVFADEERAQLAVIRQGGEEILARAQAHPLLCGRVLRLAQWCGSIDSKADLDVFAAYTEAIYRVLGEDIDCRPELDTVRRALLSMKHPGYPVVRRGDTVLTLCWNVYDWQRLMQQSPGIIRQLLDRVISSRTPAEAVMEEMSAHAGRDNPYHMLLHSPALMGRCSRRLLYRPCQPFIGLRDSADGDYRWYVEQSPVKFDISRWTPMMLRGSRTLCTSHRRLGLTVELLWLRPGRKTPSDPPTFIVRVLADKDDPSSASRVKVDLRRLAGSLPQAFGPCAGDACEAPATSASAALSILHTVLKTI